jgi:hypothetical protein
MTAAAAATRLQAAGVDGGGQIAGTVWRVFTSTMATNAPAPGDQIHLSGMNAHAPRENAPAAQAQPPGRERFAAPPPRLGGLDGSPAGLERHGAGVERLAVQPERARDFAGGLGRGQAG